MFLSVDGFLQVSTMDFIHWFLLYFVFFCGKGRSPASSGTRTVQDSKYGYTGQSLRF